MEFRAATSDPLVDWITHYTGRMDLADVEWWGYTYQGLPFYMTPGYDFSYTSGLTIQRFVEPSNPMMLKALDEGTIGPAYWEPEYLDIPVPGCVNVRDVIERHKRMKALEAADKAAAAVMKAGAA